MTTTDREDPDLRQTLNALSGNYTAAYMAAQSLRQRLESRPDSASSGTITALEGVLTRPDHLRQRTAELLYKDAAAMLALLFRNTNQPRLAMQAGQALRCAAFNRPGKQRLAAAAGLGLMPLRLDAPQPESSPSSQPTHAVAQAAASPDTHAELLDWATLVERIGARPTERPQSHGRSLAARLAQPERLLVVKRAYDQEAADLLFREAWWMEHLCLGRQSDENGSLKPYRVDENYLFSFIHDDVDAITQSICFEAPATYFTYPNDHRPGHLLPEAQFEEALGRSARLFGKYAAVGVVHTAPIPLFHNRVQRGRREDQGRYLWDRLGRLDKWLHSCRFPNFGVSGVRDFEHFSAFQAPGREFYRLVGDQVLSLILVVGSYFRHKSPERVGHDVAGRPVDARELFDQALLERLLQGIFLDYFHGFTGQAFNGAFPFEVSGLAARMIDEMGVDRHMEEILRVEDQEAMSDEEFIAFLLERDVSPARARRLQRGQAEVTMLTGPHLGEFNGSISLPELIEYVALVAGVCIAGRYAAQAGIPALL